MLVETDEVEVQVLYPVIIQDVLRSDELAEVEIVQQASFGEREELLVVQRRLLPLNASHGESCSALVAYVERLLVCCSQTVAQRLCVFQEQVFPCILVDHHISPRTTDTVLQLQMLAIELSCC